MVGEELPAPDPELQLFVNRNFSTTTRNRSGGRQHFWALTICAHCRRWAPTTKVFACCQMGAHHREVVLVDVKGARESVGILCPNSEQLVQKTTRVLPPVKGLELGTIVDLDPDSTVKVDDRVTFVVSCEDCAGLSLGHCIDKGHVQLVGFSWVATCTGGVSLCVLKNVSAVCCSLLTLLVVFLAVGLDHWVALRPRPSLLDISLRGLPRVP